MAAHPDTGALSSVGRASRLHREGRRFEPVSAHHIGDFAAAKGHPTNFCFSKAETPGVGVQVEQSLNVQLANAPQFGTQAFLVKGVLCKLAAAFDPEEEKVRRPAVGIGLGAAMPQVHAAI
jgi:hypothetical protein